MKKSFLNIFDPSLSILSAKKKGYCYVDDIIISKDANWKITNIFLQVLAENNFMIGIPHNKNLEFFGLYISQESIKKLRSTI